MQIVNFDAKCQLDANCQSLFNESILMQIVDFDAKFQSDSKLQFDSKYEF